MDSMDSDGRGSMMKMRWTRLIALVWLLAAANVASAFTTDTLQVHSVKMEKDVPVIVLLPDGYRNSKTVYPVFYLLHGATGSYKDWPQRTNIGELVDQYDFITVCPDAGNSWYFDSPEDPKYQYETFVSSELVRYIDDRYRTRANRVYRAIGGTSMGGHGALFLAIRHPDVFGIAIGFSGGYELRPFADKWEIKKRIGTIEAHPERWDELCVLNQAKILKNKELAISFECGMDDFFIENNRRLHAELMAKKVEHIYTERPGQHDWPYWKDALPYQVLWMAKQFDHAGEHLYDSPRSDPRLIMEATYDPTNGTQGEVLRLKP